MLYNFKMDEFEELLKMPRTGGLRELWKDELSEEVRRRFQIFKNELSKEEKEE